MTYERDRETVVTTDRRDGPGMGTILGIVILVLLILAAVWWFGLGGGGGAGPTTAPGGGATDAPTAPALESPPMEASPTV
jgi:hypothetical protein